MPEQARRLIVSVLVCCTLLANALQANTGQAAELIRNGDFSNGIAEWHLAAGIDPHWDPLESGSGAANLHPPTTGMHSYYGPVLFQNLNVSDIADKRADLSFALHATYTPPEKGKAVVAGIVYVDAAGLEHFVELAVVANAGVPADPASPLVVTADHTFPSDATRLIRFVFAKNHDGSFNADNVSLTMDGATVDGLPAILSQSVGTIAYGDHLTITGENFGSGGPGSTVLLGGRPEGIQIDSWTDTNIEVTVNAPAASGILQVVAKGAASEGIYLAVLSPHFSISGGYFYFKVVKGEKVHAPLGLRFHNDFTLNGQSVVFSLPPQFDEMSYHFAPQALAREGGTMLTIDTKNLSPGVHEIEVLASVGTHGDLVVTGLIHVTTVSSITFLDGANTPISAYTITNQGMEYGIRSEAIDNEGNPINDWIVPHTITASEPSVVLVNRTFWSTEYYAIDSGETNITLTYPDGTSAVLPVTVTLPADPHVDLTIIPSTVTNKHTDPINYHASATQALTGYGQQGYLGLIEDNRRDSMGVSTFSGSFKLDLTTPPELGANLFTSSTTGAQAAALLTIVNDDTYGAVSGWVVPIDPAMMKHLFEHFTLEFYSLGGDKMFSREYLGYHGDGSYFLGAIEPGTYKVRCVTEYWDSDAGLQKVIAQWYPNGADFNSGNEVVFVAKGETPDINFFLVTPPIRQFSISGRISYPGDAPYNGKVDLLDTNNAVVASVLAVNGNYLFANVNEGNYSVRPLHAQGNPLSVALSGEDSTGNNISVTHTSLTFSGYLVMTDPSGPLMGETGVGAYTRSDETYGDYTTGADCIAENTSSLNGCDGIHLDLSGLVLSFFELANDNGGDYRVYSGAQATVGGSGGTLFRAWDLNITMEPRYNANTTTGAGVAALDPMDPDSSLPRDELSGLDGQVEFVFTSFSPIVQEQSGVYAFTVDIRPAMGPMPEILFGEHGYRQFENGGDQVVTVTLSHEPTRTVAVDYATIDGTARAGTDYTPTSGTLIWTPGSGLTREIVVPIISDQEPEEDETYTISLSNPVNGILHELNAVTVVITESVPPPTISFSGTVIDINKAPVDGATIALVSAAQAGMTTSTVDGKFELQNLPAGTPFHLRISKGQEFAPTYTANMMSDANLAGGEFTLFPQTKLADWGIEQGKGVIRGSIHDYSQESNPPVAGAVVSASGKLQAHYTVCYDDACSATIASTQEGTGRYFIKNVLDNDVVTVTATKDNWSFNTRTFHAHAGGISLGKIMGRDVSADIASISASFQSAVEALKLGEQGLETFMALVSLNYLNSGETRDALLADLEEMHNEPLEYVIQSLQITGDQAVMNVLWNDMEEETLIFKKEGDAWLLYGDQQRHYVKAFSMHWANGYNAGFWIDHRPDIVGVSVAGPGINGSLSLKNFGEGWSADPSPFIGNSPQNPGPTYTITVTDNTGTYPYTRQITGWVANFATNLSPVGWVEGNPVFSWDGITGAAEYSVELNRLDNNQMNRIWNQYDVPATQFSAAYNGAPLEHGKTYVYWIVSRDSQGNSSFAEGRFTHGRISGDVNGDGRRTLEDAILALQVSIGMAPQISTSGDTNGDGKIGADEAVYILRRLGATNN